jgi:hypothetical protein
MAREVIRHVRAGGVVTVLLASVSYVPANDIERVAMSRVRLTTEASAVKACTRVGWVNDDSVKDLRRKIIRSGGDTGLITFGIGDDMSQIYAQVYRCPQPPAAPPPPPVPPPPPPPPGPPPPGPTR